MSSFPATTVKVVKVEPRGESRVSITLEMLVDVHRLAEVSGDLMRMSVRQLKGASKMKK